MKLIVGLGNPEIKYFYTRHNTGFLAIDKLLDSMGGVKLNDSKFNGVYVKTKIENEDIIIAKPMTYMNLSGEFIKPFADYYKILPCDIVVIYDDIAINLGHIKLTKTGSAGGHNGIKSIIQHLGTCDFIKFRIGIGPVPKEILILNYVLMKYDDEAFKIQNKVFEIIPSVIKDILKHDMDFVMNKYNSFNIKNDI